MTALQILPAWRAFAAAAMLFLVSCAAPSRTAHLELGDFAFQHQTYDLKDAHLVRTDFDRTSKHDTTRVLTPTQVSYFWQTMAAADVQHWLPKYESGQKDGRSSYMSWLLEVRTDRYHYKGEGRAAFPGDRNPRLTQPLDSSRRFDAVFQAFRTLFPE